MIRFEDTNEPDSQTGQKETEKNEKSDEDKEKCCRKVNLVVEGYYPPATNSGPEKTNVNVESVVSSTVGTPPLPQTAPEYLDLLSEGLEIPVSQSNLHTTTTTTTEGKYRVLVRLHLDVSHRIYLTISRVLLNGSG